MLSSKLTATLDELLEIPDFPDFRGAFNGVQVELPERVETVATAVDACTVTARDAVAAGADLLLTHHGIMWGGPQRFAGALYDVLEALLRGNCGLYCAHLPLDAHPTYGNNPILARKLGLNEVRAFGHYKERAIGVIGRTGIRTPEDAAQAIGIGIGEAVPAHGEVETMAIVSGSGGSMIDEAVAAGADVLLTGELGHHDRVAARDRGLGVWIGGHYQTETFCVRALGEHLAETYQLRHVFLDAPTGA